MKTENNSLYGIKTKEERDILISWSMIVLVSSLIGDNIILIGTIKYKAIRQHEMIVAVIQHMAVCDLLQTVFRVFPDILALISVRWVLGEMLCHLQENINWVCAGVAMYLTCGLTTIKLIIVERPLRAAAWTKKLGHTICCALWFLKMCWYTPILVVNLSSLRKTVYFSYKEYNCEYDISSSSAPAWYPKYFVIIISINCILCYTTMIVTSSLILIVARRAAIRQRRSLRWEGVTTVLITAVVFLISYLPYGALVVTSAVVGVEYGSALWRATNNLTYLNIMANFFVYCLTIRSFRLFLKLKISELLTLLKRCSQQTAQLQERPYPTLATGSTQINSNFHDISM
jgi:uncharacterized membrane protein